MRKKIVVSRAHELVTRALLTRAHDLLSRAHDLLSRAHEIYLVPISCRRDITRAH